MAVRPRLLQYSIHIKTAVYPLPPSSTAKAGSYHLGKVKDLVTLVLEENYMKHDHNCAVKDIVNYI